MQSCDSATPGIPKIVTQKIFLLYLNCDPATLRLLRFQKLRAKKYISIHLYRICNPATLRFLRFQKLLPKIIFLLYWNCNLVSLRLLRFQKLRAKKIFQSIYTESAILRLCDSCNSKNCYPFILNSCYPCNYDQNDLPNMSAKMNPKIQYFEI